MTPLGSPTHLEHHKTTHLGHHRQHFCESVATGQRSLRSPTQKSSTPLGLDMGTWGWGAVGAWGWDLGTTVLQVFWAGGFRGGIWGQAFRFWGPGQGERYAAKTWPLGISGETVPYTLNTTEGKSNCNSSYSCGDVMAVKVPVNPKHEVQELPLQTGGPPQGGHLHNGAGNTRSAACSTDLGLARHWF